MAAGYDYWGLSRTSSAVRAGGARLGPKGERAFDPAAHFIAFAQGFPPLVGVTADDAGLLDAGKVNSAAQALEDLGVKPLAVLVQNQTNSDNDAFARGKSVSLDDNRQSKLRERPMCLGRQVRSDVGSRRDPMLPTQILGESLRAFELCGRCVWAESSDARSPQGISDTSHKRSFRADDNQVDRFLFS